MPLALELKGPIVLVTINKLLCCLFRLLANMTHFLYLWYLLYLLIAWLSLNFILYTSWVALSSIVCQSVSQSVRHRCHPTKSPLFPIYTGIQALCWPNTIYKGIKALFWVTHSILGLVFFNFLWPVCLIVISTWTLNEIFFMFCYCL